MSIIGKGSDKTIVDGSTSTDPNFGSVFAIGMDENHNYVPGVVATLSGMTIRGGTGTLTNYYQYGLINEGGGIWNAGDLTLERCKITENHVYWEPWNPFPTVSAGGGIYNDHLGKATINDCTISGNEAYWGAGIYNEGSLMVNGGTILGNNGGSGSGIYGSFCPYDPTAKVDMLGCTIIGNIAYYWGGGIENFAPMTLTDCMITGNVASPGGVGWPVGLGPVGGYAGWKDVLTLQGTTQIMDNTPINIFYVPH